MVWLVGRRKRAEVLPKLILPEKFSYRQVKRMTKNFSSKLGNGGFGQVYEGKLRDGTRVAVKVLHSCSSQGEKEFKAEVTSMAGIHHKNVVPFRGYCISRRILVYEFMANGSLDQWLFAPQGKEQLLNWPMRFQIAMGMARGLRYLHEECTQQIMHLDIKPENILLDENFLPKVTDFGLSKLVDRDKAPVVTNMRGTPGYLAPEWLQPDAPVSTRIDVYGYGIVLLELVCGREAFQVSSSRSSEEWYLPPWAARLVAEGRSLELVDAQLNEEVEYFYRDQATRSIQTALCCIHQDPLQRPAMSKVVQMLEGVVEIPRQVKAKLSHQFSAADKVKQELQAFASNLRRRRAGGSSGGSSTDFSMSSAEGASQKPKTPLRAIPPWPLRGDVVTIQGSELSENVVHAVVRDVKASSQQVRLGILYKMDMSNRWGVAEEETSWRNWNVLVSTLRFWTPVKWVSIPGPVGGINKVPIEWIAKL